MGSRKGYRDSPLIHEEVDGAWMLSLCNYYHTIKIKQKSLNHLYRSQFNCTPPTKQMKTQTYSADSYFYSFPWNVWLRWFGWCTILYIIIVIIFARNQFETCCNNIRRYRKSDNNKNSPSAPAHHGPPIHS